tara:strand:- start:1642 stop:1854 length:213 start_codon:yes stop_codon:yes gene_type:complete
MSNHEAIGSTLISCFQVKNNPSGISPARGVRLLTLQHLQRLAQIYKDAGGSISLGRKNPSRENPSSWLLF